ncbi:PEPxxWA-CTERM sorting domain-containing protein [Sandarakinorhabdus sp.]|uniref:PEPxxWA-CTERM sorting domain-containing protein n=1 Tax=Sandarakinorhabdus sp. TaxID=1916663 RepID=UPI00286E3FFE|nr:PEPxxWA-CTERM sorting domain-containing protein [Sandarakinorhabdus sp.]
MRKVLAAAALAMAIAAPSSAASILNGSFESSLGLNPLGWRVTATGGRTGALFVVPANYIPSFPAADSGRNALRIRSGVSPANTWTLAQTVATNTGQAYILRFSMLNQGQNATESVNVTAGTGTFSLGNTAPYGWTDFTLPFFATSASTIVSFTMRHTGQQSFYMYLDSVSLSVPEPTSWAMMLAGFGMVGFAARRRRKMIAA